LGSATMMLDKMMARLATIHGMTSPSRETIIAI
jgi:hypothetical protein